jgi:hypothetical protein
MSLARRGEIWLVDLGMVQKTRHTVGRRCCAASVTAKRQLRPTFVSIIRVREN